MRKIKRILLIVLCLCLLTMPMADTKYAARFSYDLRVTNSDVRVFTLKDKDSHNRSAGPQDKTTMDLEPGYHAVMIVGGDGGPGYFYGGLGGLGGVVLGAIEVQAGDSIYGLIGGRGAQGQDYFWINSSLTRSISYPGLGYAEGGFGQGSNGNNSLGHQTRGSGGGGGGGTTLVKNNTRVTTAGGGGGGGIGYNSSRQGTGHGGSGGGGAVVNNVVPAKELNAPLLATGSAVVKIGMNGVSANGAFSVNRYEEIGLHGTEGQGGQEVLGGTAGDSRYGVGGYLSKRGGRAKNTDIVVYPDDLTITYNEPLQNIHTSIWSGQPTAGTHFYGGGGNGSFGGGGGGGYTGGGGGGRGHNTDIVYQDSGDPNARGGGGGGGSSYASAQLLALPQSVLDAFVPAANTAMMEQLGVTIKYNSHSWSSSDSTQTISKDGCIVTMYIGTKPPSGSNNLVMLMASLQNNLQGLFSAFQGFVPAALLPDDPSFG